MAWDISSQAYDSPWRKRYGRGRFRSAAFHIETDSRTGGRRVVPHQYPKRNVPYAEDMGRRMNGWSIAAYVVGPNYLTEKEALIEALEQDGPGYLRVSLPYLNIDVQVMAGSYSVTETRERGGMAVFEMEFMEYGSPAGRPNQSGPGAVQNGATALENNVINQPTRPAIPTAQTMSEVQQYIEIWKAFTPPQQQLSAVLQRFGGFIQ